MKKMNIEYFSPEMAVITLIVNKRTIICTSITMDSTVDDYISNDYEW